jgi:uncharacterized protein (TIGR03067 family)
MMIRFLSLAMGLVFLASTSGTTAAPGLKEKEEATDLKKLQGDWEVTSWEQLGQAMDLTAKWSFKDDKYTLQLGANLEEGSIKLEPGKKPATIDLVITGGNCKGKDQPGIYKIDGDTITFCFAWPGTTDRPTEFKSTAEGRTILVTVKRAKKDD